MSRACDSCGSLYEPLRKTSRYCSGKCRKRAQRSGLAKPQSTDRPSAPAAAAGSLHAAVLVELKNAQKETTALGQACLALARRIDSGASESGSAIAALTRELRASLAEALKVPTGSGDLLDELARKRQERLAAAGG